MSEVETTSLEGRIKILERGLEQVHGMMLAMLKAINKAAEAKGDLTPATEEQAQEKQG